MRKIMMAGTALVALTLGAGAAMAANGVCTDDLFEAKQGDLMAYIGENPAKAAKLEDVAAEVEKDYGGDPPEEKRCEAMDKLQTLLKAS